jgi:Tol biopolymer transport system component
LKPADGVARAVPVKGVPAGEPYRATYAPDGKWIVYTLRHDGKNDIHALELATQRDIALTSDGQSWNPVFSPDGSQIAFLRSASFSIDLYVMDLGGVLTSAGGAPKGTQKMTNGEGIDGADRPSWGR